MNPKANGQLQTEWSWWIAAYLFLGGIGGGAYAIAAVNWFLGESASASTAVGLWIGFPALLIGSVFLLVDLGTPRRAVLAGMKPGTSWIARGFWIITAFMVLALLHLILHAFTAVGQTASGRMILSVVGAAGIVCAVGTMAYTGILLGASKGIPFWRTGAVPVVFVISALVTGHFTIMLIAPFYRGVTAEAVQTMSLEAAALVVLEVLAILFFLQAAFKTPDPRESALRILRKRSFVIGYFILGLAVPFVTMLIVYRSVASTELSSYVPIAAGAALLGLVGGLILRQSVLVCGALPTLNIAGFEFRRIARPKDPKPGIGMLPPQ
ncbi:MAG: polysulfide reductase NrfD [Gemmatimonadota bacterium]|nr:MAG: polysulfide reductase NrfD [Gemmatimonadota bacterium]